MMRTVYFSDLRAAGRVLLACSASVRQAKCKELLQQADIADRVTRNTGKLHPKWGNGTLYDAAVRQGVALEPSLDDPDYALCLEIVLRQLRQRPRGTYL
ncbi:MAG: hypothetical protein AB8B60_01620 [Sulfitobacter sp.]